jgi:hypothetical protein
VLADRRMLRWLIGASLAWLLFDFVYYGNTISSPLIVSLVAPHASLMGQTAYTLAIFAGAIVTITMLPEPKGQSLETLTGETSPQPTSATVLGLAESRGLRPPPA